MTLDDILDQFKSHRLGVVDTVLEVMNLVVANQDKSILESIPDQVKNELTLMLESYHNCGHIEVISGGGTIIDLTEEFNIFDQYMAQ
ncbi:hypothetical protein EUZ85_17540 [Hahella sp. KA22]|uniref:hypothetical protein n=1 Tax=Hahella sp. KA22 TaxID=1628392 RepID=UPI000FDE412C|nr:hypothetical protein [Hahella sp. KA22]AZZ92427.1 hypothetical protein ENC22_14965 [Hahella sp. KA22]QAY55801.1 hypothetical protein EUZ85_17540 [Hahella sp. KA22]